MPFTTFHFGPGAALKTIMRARFSLTVFCYSQVITDLESGYYLFRGEYPVHRFMHTYLGATLIGLACGLTGRRVCQLFLRLFGRAGNISWGVAFASAFIGTYSHVFLDSIMHRDVFPFRPFTDENPMLHLVSLSLLHVICLALGVLGVFAYLKRNGRTI
jgi:membrane-bound metal-dependent hydrolase YbcI (DUF457 family)